MKAVILKDPNDPASLTLQETKIGSPRIREAKVRITSVGLNRADLLYPQGRYFQKPIINSRIGFEGAGIVEEAGADSIWQKGDRVGICPMLFDVVSQGCLAEYGIYQDDQLLPAPPGIALEKLGAIWMANLTAWGGLVDCGQMQQGDYVVITAASSSVGIAAIQLCKLLGAVSIATTTSDEKAAHLKKAGADHVIVQAKGQEGIDHYVARVRTITGDQGSDLVFDAVAGPCTHGLVKASKRGGTIVIQGMLDRRPMDIHAGVLMKRLLTIKGYTLDYTLSRKEARTKAIKTIQSGFEQGVLQPIIAASFKLNEFQSALEMMAANKHTGKIIITP